VEQHVRRIAERDEQVDPAVVVEVDPGHLARFAFDVDAEVVRDVGESAAAVVPIEFVCDARSPREPDVEVEAPVGVRIAPRRGARIRQVRHPGLPAGLDERAAIVAVQAVCDAVLEPDEEVEITVVVVIGPAAWLPASHRKQLWLDELEARRGGRIRAAPRKQPVPRRHRTHDPRPAEPHEAASIHSHGVSQNRLNYYKRSEGQEFLVHVSP
jgi:hypothetical protein